MNHRPVCVKCQCELRPETTGVGLLDMFNPIESHDPQPYQIWDADLYECPTCHYQIVVGFGQGPISQHHEEEHALTRAIRIYERRSRVIRNY